MTEPEILAILTVLFRDILDNPTIELRLTDMEREIPGFDSARKVHLLLAVEERFGVRLRSREIDALRSIADWTRVIYNHRGGVAS